MKTLRALILSLVVAGAVLAVPAIASADTYCINAGAACPAGGHEFGDVQPVLEAAAASDVSDELLLGDKDTPYFGPFLYEPTAVRGGNRLTVQGVGGRPSLTAAVGDTILTASDIALEDVDVLAEFGEGQAMTIRNSSLSHVNVVGPAFDAPDVHGIRAEGPVTITDTRVTGGFEEGLSTFGALAGEEVTARRLRIDGSGVGAISVTDGSSLTLSDSRVTAFSQGIRVAGSLHMSRSVLATTGPDSRAVAEVSGARVGGAILDHVTIAHLGAPSGEDTAFLIETDTPDAETRLHAVAIAGYTRAFRRVPISVFPHAVVVKESVWDPAQDQLGGPALGVFVEADNAHVAPALVNLAGGDLHPTAGSAAIDRDGLSDITQYADLDGTPALDGNGDGIVRPDAGAFEFRPSPPPPAPAPPAGDSGGTSSAGTGSGPAADLSAPVLSRLGLRSGRRPIAQASSVSLARARRLRLVLTSSEAARVKVVPRRVVGGRLTKPLGSIARSVVAGRSSIALGKALRRVGALRPGQLRLIVTATDAAGNRSAKRVLKLRLTR
jgi:hypothetical protein